MGNRRNLFHLNSLKFQVKFEDNPLLDLYKIILIQVLVDFDLNLEVIPLINSTAGIYLFNETICEICSKLTIRKHVILVCALLTLNRFHILFWCFHCWLWRNKCRLEFRITLSGNKTSVQKYCTYFLQDLQVYLLLLVPLKKWYQLF